MDKKNFLIELLSESVEAAIITVAASELAKENATPSQALARFSEVIDDVFNIAEESFGEIFEEYKADLMELKYNLLKKQVLQVNMADELAKAISVFESLEKEK